MKRFRQLAEAWQAVAQTKRTEGHTREAEVLELCAAQLVTETIPGTKPRDAARRARVAIELKTHESKQQTPRAALPRVLSARREG